MSGAWKQRMQSLIGAANGAAIVHFQLEHPDVAEAIEALFDSLDSRGITGGDDSITFAALPLLAYISERCCK